MAGAHLDSRPGRAPGSTTTAPARRRCSRSPSRSRSCRSSPRTSSASPGGAPRRRAWSARPSTSSELTEEEGADIALYLNFDMIALAELRAADLRRQRLGVRRAGAGRLGRDRAHVPALLRSFRSRQRPDGVRRTLGLRAVHRGRDPGRRPVHRRRERQDRGPQAALYGGTAGEAFDPCYHQACDDIENISERGLNQMSDAVAHAVNYYAYSLKFIPRPDRRRSRRRSTRRAYKSKYLGDSLVK